jgi:hypothetical protein
MRASRQSHTKTTEDSCEVLSVAYYQQNQVKSENYCLKHYLDSSSLQSGWVFAKKVDPDFLNCEEKRWDSTQIIDSMIGVRDQYDEKPK